MAPRRYGDRPRQRRAGAGRPRNRPRDAATPVDEEILGAAARLFARQGVAATTMAQIAEAVGLGVSSLYYYFGNKAAVLERIVVDVNQIPLAIAARVCEVHPDAPRRLHAFVREDAAALCELPFDINEIHRLAGEDEAMFARYWADRQQLLDEVRSIVEEGIAAGEFRPVDPLLTALTLLANDEAAQNWYRPTGTRRRAGSELAALSPAAVGCYLADLALRGLLVDVARLEGVRDATGGDPLASDKGHQVDTGPYFE